MWGDFLDLLKLFLTLEIKLKFLFLYLLNISSQYVGIAIRKSPVEIWKLSTSSLIVKLPLLPDITAVALVIHIYVWNILISLAGILGQ